MAIQFYRKPNDKNLYEVGTNRPISATEFGIGTPNAGRGFQEVTQQQNNSPTGQVQIPNVEAMKDYTNITSPKPGDPRLYGTPIQRDGADLKVAAAGLDQWKNNTNLIEGARNIIQMKQGLNKDIQAAKQVWRDKATDNTTFEGQGQKQFTELSPAEQADIRSQRYTTAQSHIKGLSEEEEYRSVRTEDILLQLQICLQKKINLIKQN